MLFLAQKSAEMFLCSSYAGGRGQWNLSQKTCSIPRKSQLHFFTVADYACEAKMIGGSAPSLPSLVNPGQMPSTHRSEVEGIFLVVVPETGYCSQVILMTWLNLFVRKDEFIHENA
jgi:hypothetical protein